MPLPEPPAEGARGWPSTKRGRRELKDSAEKAAREDAVKRAKRRKQIWWLKRIYYTLKLRKAIVETYS